MGKRSAPKGRLALRFDALEVVVMVVALVIIAAGWSFLFSQVSRAERILGDRSCVEAEVTRSGSSHSFRFGRSASVAYVVDDRGYGGTLHYDADRLAVDSHMIICTDPHDPTTFAASIGNVTGMSTNLWLRYTFGGVASAVALVCLIVLLSRHEWRVFDEPPAGAGV